MAGFIAGVERGQAVLFPERLDELVPGDAVVRVIDAFVSGLDLARAGFIRSRAAGVGRPGYHPGDLLRLYIYGYMNGVRSSRALERECWRNLELAWLLRRLRPDFKTIADFRKDNGDAIGGACRSFVRFSLARELIRPVVVAADGSRFSAVSSRRKRQKREDVEAEAAAREAEVAAHEAAIRRYLADLAEADGEVDEAGVEAEKARVRAAIEELEAAARKKRNALAATDAKSLVVDEPEAVIFGRRRGRRGSPQPSYTVQLAVDAESQVVLDAEAIATPTDAGQLAPVAGRVAEVLDAVDDVTLVADAGYSSAGDAAACEALGLVPVFPVTRSANPHGPYFDRSAFTYDAAIDRLICPHGKQLKPQPAARNGAIRYVARKADCSVCPLKHQCTTAKARAVHRLIHEDALARVEQRLKDDPTLMKKRARSVEPAFGTLKRWMHGGRFLLKGRAKASIEIRLVALAFNIKRMIGLHGAPRLIQAMA